MNFGDRPVGVSIIVPSYGRDPFLGAVLGALEKQTLKPQEVVVSHSGLCNPENEIAAAHPEVRVLHSDNRRLPGAARNAGAAIARGDWLCFVDSDVLVPAHWVESLLRAVAGTEPNTAICSAVACGSDAGYWASCLWWIEFGSVHPYLPRQKVESGATAGMLIGRRRFDELKGFREDLYVGEDSEFFSRHIADGGSLIFQPYPPILHMFREGPRHCLRRLSELGLYSASFRKDHSQARGAYAVKWPILSLGLWIARVYLIYARALRSSASPKWNLFLHTPGIIAGLLVWNWHFTKEAFRRTG